MSKRVILKGVCHFHSETGSGGGYWAFQDKKFIQKNVPRGYCKKCGRCLTPEQWECLERNKGVLFSTTNLSIPWCKNGKHEEEISDLWSYEGLNYLENGDILTIYSPNNPKKIEWRGTISLIRNTSEPLTHTDQQGVEREKWTKYFLEKYPAQLIKARKS
ncbi:hypothetical protein L6259_03030 [Candidatus Parcubacteria bacterium]|nr:hypothetical protein [Patescibacteria group bacterium]MCG2694213.1 hypothetical protein [Candidatus Parcubacteria bacterium]